MKLPLDKLTRVPELPLPTPDFAYVELQHLVSTWTEKNKRPIALRVDRMLLDRDDLIAKATQRAVRAEAAVERYQEENAALRGYCGRVRSLILEAALLLRDTAVDVLTEDLPRVGTAVDLATQALKRAIELTIPRAGAKLGPPLFHVFSNRGRVQLCADCDRPKLCANLAPRTAPCGQNQILELETEVSR